MSRVGDFSFELDAAGARAKHLLTPASNQAPGASPDGGKIVWSSPGAHAFVTALKGDMRTIGVAGHLSIVEKVKTRFEHQTVDAVQMIETGLVLRGRLGEARSPAAVEGAGAPRSIGYRLSITSVDPQQLELALELDDEEGVWAQLNWASGRAAAKFGFGVQFSRVNLSGKRVPLLTAEQGVGRGAQPLTLAAELLGGAGGQWWSTYAPVPFVLESELRALYLTDSSPMQFDLRHESMASVLVYAPRLTARAIGGDSPAALIEAYTRFAGRMEPLPEWTDSGAIIGLQGGGDKVEKVVADLQRHEAPLAGVWLQDWVGNRRVPFGQRLWWDWQLDPDTYPAWDRLVARLADEGLNVLVYINPFLADMSERPGGRPDLLGAAKSGGHLVKDDQGRPYMVDQGDFEAGLVDLSDHASREWYLATLTEQLGATGALGWMADFGEGLPLDAVLSVGDAVEWHNHYPQVWAEFNRELRYRLAARSGRKPTDYVAFFRSGYAKSPAGASLFWLGDQTVTWDEHDGLRSAFKGLLSSGFSGYSLQHGDVGGYTSTVSPLPRRVRTRELLARWGELMAFTVVLRTHEGNRPALNTQVYSTEETLADFARAARLHAAWRPLRRRLMDEAAATGMPVVRHPWLAYPEDERTLLVESQFFLGSDVLVAPVLDPKRSSVRAYLPAGSGTWSHAFGENHYGRADLAGARAAGGAVAASPVFDPTTAGDAPGIDSRFDAGSGRWVSVPAPLGRPGVFVRCHDVAIDELVARLRKAAR